MTLMYIGQHGYDIVHIDVHWGTQLWHCSHWCRTLGNTFMTLLTLMAYIGEHNYDTAHFDVYWATQLWRCLDDCCALGNTSITLLTMLLCIGEHNYDIAHIDAVHWGAQLWYCSHWCCALGNTIPWHHSDLRCTPENTILALLTLRVRIMEPNRCIAHLYAAHKGTLLVFFLHDVLSTNSRSFSGMLPQTLRPRSLQIIELNV